MMLCVCMYVCAYVHAYVRICMCCVSICVCLYIMWWCRFGVDDEFGIMAVSHDGVGLQNVRDVAC